MLIRGVIATDLRQSQLFEVVSARKKTAEHWKLIILESALFNCKLF